MTTTTTEPIQAFGPTDERSLNQLETCLGVAGEGALGVLCADHHLGYSMPIGGVLASREWVFPAAVGYDIACGNCAMQTPLKHADLAGDVPALMNDVWRTISFGVGRRNNEPIEDHPVFGLIAAAHVKEQAKLLDMARGQLGTVGSGNHYVDLFVDDQGYVWVGVHFGSRGFGHRTCTGFLAIASGDRWGDKVRDGGMDAVPHGLRLDSPAGQDYLAAMALAGHYAYAGREWVCRRVLKILGTSSIDTVHNHHNFAWMERHGGELYCVMRKGATPAFPGQRGFVGASMFGTSVVLSGRETPANRDGLYSTVHGAGRVMSRREAAGKVKRYKVWECGHRECDVRLPAATPRGPDGANPRCPRCGEKTHKRQLIEHVSRGRVDFDKVRLDAIARGVELRGGGADEAPACYKDLDEVLAHHGETIVVERRLRPIGVAMAGQDEFDPYKD